MKFFSTNPLILLAQFFGLIVLFTTVVIIGGLLLFNNPLAGFKQASNIPPTKFKATTVQRLVTEYAEYSDGDGIELTVYLTKTAIDAEKLLQSPEGYGLTVYKAKDSPRATAEIYLLSKKGDLRGCESQKLRSFLHKNHEGLKLLEEVAPINSGKIAP